MVYMVELLFRGGGEAYPSSKSKSSGIIARTNHFQTVLARRRRQFQYISRDYKHSLIGDSSILHYLTTLALSEQPIIGGGGADRSPRIIHITRSRLTCIVLARHRNSSVSVILIGMRGRKKRDKKRV